MKAILLALSALFAVSAARGIVNVEEHSPRMLGAQQCTWGPGYWCMNITNAAGCNATSHCIEHVWSTMHVPEDDDSVCKICKDMVGQARDQLESNQTQADLKAVFEGSCRLMMIKPIVDECDRLVDQFIPELVETLASQMNPSVVCSVAGLCNSARIDQLLVEHEAMLKKINAKAVSLQNDELTPDECSRCYTIASHMENQLSNTPRDRMVNELLSLCGQFSSFSDACSSIILVNFETIYDHLKNNFNADNICHLSGQCSSKYHRHEEEADKGPAVEIRPLSTVGVVDIGEDLPCKLCEQLVGHLRDLLVANTTELEFQQVLDGLCKQTKSFADECKSLVDQYYSEIYEYLVHRLNSNAICQLGGICPEPGKMPMDRLIMPLLPLHSAEIGIRVLNEQNEKNVEIGGVGQSSAYPRTEADEMQLPIERFQPFATLSLPKMDVEGQKTCAFCEYLLHYLQQVITSPTTEDQVREVLEKVCTKLPQSVEGTCNEFVDTYEDALVALLAQEIDPSIACPMLHICPSQAAMEAWEAIPEEMTLRSNVEEKPSCPLCLLALSQLYNVIKDNKTEESIQRALDKLCDDLPKDLNHQCASLVKGYSKELIDMLLADLTPQEVCVYIKLCNAQKNVGPTDQFPMDKDGEIMTNEIPNFPIHKDKHLNDGQKCVICEYVMQYLEKQMKNKSTKDEIEKVVHGICNYLPKTVSQQCNTFVNQYADLVIDLLAQEVSPKEICTAMGLCQAALKKMMDSIAECALCQAIISSIDSMLVNPEIDQKIEDIVGKVCTLLPGSKQGKCTMMLEVYEQSIINLLKAGVNTREVCKKIALCSNSDFFAMSNPHFRDRRADDLGKKRCTWGDEYRCSDMRAAEECDAVNHCKTNVWKSNSPTNDRGESTEEKSRS
ncbi:proactivator polypeptide [Fopius arisanus]|uniref:PSAP_1 protein n=2 Tax=Fopius arisanus TaxID=64838 RepID=A0A0C9R481_9HYME|nr:PREDICTED: proactivator polypeptide [Fopius arisanus]